MGRVSGGLPFGGTNSCASDFGRPLPDRDSLGKLNAADSTSRLLDSDAARELRGDFAGARQGRAESPTMAHGQSPCRLPVTEPGTGAALGRAFEGMKARRASAPAMIPAARDVTLGDTFPVRYVLPSPGPGGAAAQTTAQATESAPSVGEQEPPAFWRFDATRRCWGEVTHRAHSNSDVHSAPLQLADATRLRMSANAVSRYRMPVLHDQFKHEGGALSKLEWVTSKDDIGNDVNLVELSSPFNGALAVPERISLHVSSDAPGVVKGLAPCGFDGAQRTMTFESPYGMYFKADGSMRAMIDFMGWHYRFDPSGLGVGAMQGGLVQESDDDAGEFALAGALIAKMQELAPIYLPLDKPSLPGRLDVAWVKDDETLSRYFRGAGKRLTRQLGTMIGLLRDDHRRAATVAKIYRNFVSSPADVVTLIRTQRDMLEQRRSDLETAFSNQDSLTVVCKFSDVVKGASGMTTATINALPYSTLYGMPTISVSRDVVARARLGASDENDAERQYLLDVIFHECGHAAADWSDDLTLTRPGAAGQASQVSGAEGADSPVLKSVYYNDRHFIPRYRHNKPSLNEPAAGPFAVLDKYCEKLKRGSIESVAHLASFNHLTRTLLLLVNAGREDVLEGLLDGSSLEFCRSTAAEAIFAHENQGMRVATPDWRDRLRSSGYVNFARSFDSLDV